MARLSSPRFHHLYCNYCVTTIEKWTADCRFFLRGDTASLSYTSEGGLTLTLLTPLFPSPGTPLLPFFDLRDPGVSLSYP